MVKYQKKIDSKLFYLKNANNDETAIKDSISYLKETVSDLSKVKIKNNIIILQGRTIPSDFELINKTVAFNAHKVLGRGVHVWSVTDDHHGWDESINTICNTTARYGKVAKSSCK